MRVALACIGRFHHFHLARQLYRKGVLEAIYTAYPRFKLRDEKLPSEMIRSFPWFITPYLALRRWGWGQSWLAESLRWWGHPTLDAYTGRKSFGADMLVALSGVGLKTGRAYKSAGGWYVCDRGSSHIAFQDRLLNEEYRRWDVWRRPTDPRIVERELLEYEAADLITVPSEFARQSFLHEGVSPGKLRKVPYGANLDRFNPVGIPDPDAFTVLFVGQISLRKGIPYLLEAFMRLKHPRKRMWIIGEMEPGVETVIQRFALDGVEFLGRVPNTSLASYYSKADVFVLPSIEEGLAMVQGEALACGCPVIATAHTGVSDLTDNPEAARVVPICSSEAIVQALLALCDTPSRRESRRHQAVESVRKLGGWDAYGDEYHRALECLRTSSGHAQSCRGASGL